MFYNSDMKNNIKYSQNLLVDTSLLEKLVPESNINKADLVLDIGAGKGAITKELLKVAGHVIAYEIDPDYIKDLKSIVSDRLSIKEGSFLGFDLPKDKYKVFANIPFNKTSEIVKRLLFSKNPPTDIYLVMQKEAIGRFSGRPFDNINSLLSVLFHPWFEFNVMHEFRKTDFKPIPNVDTVLLNIKQRNNPKVRDEDKSEYRDFVVFGFSQMSPNILSGLSRVMNDKHILDLSHKQSFSTNLKPSQLDMDNWLDLFNLLKYQKLKKRKLIANSFENWINQQENIEKINRTRVDKDWKSFK